MSRSCTYHSAMAPAIAVFSAAKFRANGLALFAAVLVVWRPLSHTNELTGDGVCRAEAGPDSPRAAPNSAVLALAKRMVVQLAKPLDTTIPITDPRVRLKGFGIPLSYPDTSGRWGHEWPGGRLTGDDMRRLPTHQGALHHPGPTNT